MNQAATQLLMAALHRPKVNLDVDSFWGHGLGSRLRSLIVRLGLGLQTASGVRRLADSGESSSMRFLRNCEDVSTRVLKAGLMEASRYSHPVDQLSKLLPHLRGQVHEPS